MRHSGGKTNVHSSSESHVPDFVSCLETLSIDWLVGNAKQAVKTANKPASPQDQCWGKSV